MTEATRTPGIETPSELLAGLRRMPVLVRELVARIPDPAAPGDPSDGWTAIEVVVHLAAADAEVWGPRLRQLADGQHPRWAWTEPDMTGRAVISPAAALEELEAGRTALVAVAAGMDAKAWRRTGTHAVFGELDVAGLLREARKHDLEHLTDLERRAASDPTPREAPGA